MTELMEFDGSTCEDCAGWDGESNRCECGNNRVAWECFNEDCKCDEVMIKNCEFSYPQAY